MSQLFDDLSRIVGSGIPRRQMLKLMAAAFTGGVLPALWPTPAAAYIACTKQFTAMWDTQTTVDCPDTLNVGPSAWKDNTCQARADCCGTTATNQAITSAQGQCPTTCPYIVVDTAWSCSGYCNAEANLVCRVSATVHCDCIAPTGKKCCGFNNFCTSGTQSCCGTFCVPFGSPCPSSASPSR
jgi:hypothetical protein